jgi:hypothetical protein
MRREEKEKETVEENCWATNRLKSNKSASLHYWMLVMTRKDYHQSFAFGSKKSGLVEKVGPS